MVDYGKFDAIDNSSDDEDATPAVAAHTEVEKNRLLALHQTMIMLTSYLIEAAPSLAEPEQARIVRFIATQDKGTDENNSARHREIVAFLDKEMPIGWASETALEPLMCLCTFANGQLSVAEGGREQVSAGRALIVAMCALNTLGAVVGEGGSARAVFDKLLAEPDGELAQRYTTLEFAKALIRTRQAAAEAARDRQAEVAAVDADAGEFATAEDEAAVEATLPPLPKPSSARRRKQAAPSSLPPRATGAERAASAALRGAMKHGMVVAVALGVRCLYNLWSQWQQSERE